MSGRAYILMLYFNYFLILDFFHKMLYFLYIANYVNKEIYFCFLIFYLASYVGNETRAITPKRRLRLKEGQLIQHFSVFYSITVLLFSFQ
jgi:hypothetical protein